MGGDDLYSFPTPSEAFGVRQQQQTRKPPPPSNISASSVASSSYTRNPPQHPQQYNQSRAVSNPNLNATPKLVPSHQQRVASNGMRPLQQQYTQSNPGTPQHSQFAPQYQPQMQNQQPRYSQQYPQYSQQQQQQQQQHQIQIQQQHQQHQQIPVQLSQLNQDIVSSQGRMGVPSPQSYSPPKNEQQSSLPNLPKDPNHRMDASQILERQLRGLFDRVDRNRDGKLDEIELGIALTNDDGTKFQGSTVRLMIRLFDTDDNTGLSFKEFYHLWNYVLHWRKTFQKFDVDNNKKISFGEYQNAIESFGYRLPTDIVLFIFQKFGDFNSSKPMTLKFDMFVESLIWLLRCTNIFKKFDIKGNGIATISFQDFVHEILSFV